MSENDTLLEPAFVPPTPTELNAKFRNRVQFLELIGKGGMGAVYRAFEPKLHRYVAVKILSAQAPRQGWDFVERFRREARALALLDHPNIVKLYDFDEIDDLLYFTMEYVEGQDLHAIFSGSQLTTEHVESWVPQVCQALEYAHSRDLIHRDVKPGNIMIDQDGKVKLTDFGLVKRKATRGRIGLTQASISIGTPNYLAPEAMESGADVDNRADIYSLGVVLYQLLTGKLPMGAWRSPSSLNPALDPRYDEIVVQAMQQEPEERFQNISQLGDAVLAIANQPRKSGTPPTSTRRSGLLLPDAAIPSVSIQTGIPVPLKSPMAS
ncbi:MAG: serine/threonine-protein kinase [Verrucomicrobiota bacterium]